MGCTGLSLRYCAETCSSRLETGVSMNLWSYQKEVKPLVMYDVEHGIALGPMQGIGLHLELIWGTPIYFRFIRRHQCPSRLVTVFLGTLCSSIKQIKAPYVFDW